MGEVVMPIGKTAQMYGHRGARAAKKINNKLQRLVRVDGEAHTMADILSRVAAPEKSVRSVISHCQKRGEPVTWARLHNIRYQQPKEVSNV